MQFIGHVSAIFLTVAAEFCRNAMSGSTLKLFRSTRVLRAIVLIGRVFAINVTIASVCEKMLVNRFAAEEAFGL